MYRKDENRTLEMEAELDCTECKKTISNRRDDGEEKKTRDVEERRRGESRRGTGNRNYLANKEKADLLSRLTIEIMGRRTIDIGIFTVFLGSDGKWVNPQ